MSILTLCVFLAYFNSLKLSETIRNVKTRDRKQKIIMATSANTLSQIISTLCYEYDLDEKQVLKQLATKNLLPAKLTKITEPKNQPMFCSKKAEELATHAKMVFEYGTGSGKNGKHTLSYVKKAIEAPTTKKFLISPTALNYANENNIVITDIKGTGKDGRVVLKDVENLKNKQSESESESESESDSD